LLALLRRRVPAAILATLIIAAMHLPRGAHPALAWLTIGVCGAAVATWLMMRFGLLTLIVTLFVSGVLITFPSSLGGDPWVADLALPPLVIAALTALCGYWVARSSAPRPT
jgi:hypothetical protein